MARVHIYLRENIDHDAVLKEICTLFSISNIDDKRYKRYKVITGDVEETDLDEIRKHLEVIKLEVEENRWILPRKRSKK